MRTTIALALILCLGGCGAVDETLQSYDAPTVKKFAVKDVDTFRIEDDAKEGRIVITMSRMAIASASLNSILTFGTSYADAPEPIMKSAVMSYLKSAGRDCSTSEEKELSRMRWEFRYQCQPVNTK